MVESNTKLGQSGGIIIPTQYRRKTSLEAGDEVIMHLDEDGLHLYTPAQAIARAQALVRRYFPVPEGGSLSEELVSKRGRSHSLVRWCCTLRSFLALRNKEPWHE